MAECSDLIDNMVMGKVSTRHMEVSNPCYCRTNHKFFPPQLKSNRKLSHNLLRMMEYVLPDGMTVKIFMLCQLTLDKKWNPVVIKKEKKLDVLLL